MAGDFVERTTGVWASWFARLRHRRAVRSMAAELLEAGPGADWRPSQTLRDQHAER